MNRNWILILLVVFSLIISSSCSNDDDSYSLGRIWISMGMIEEKPIEGYDFFIRLDNGDTIIPVTSSRYFNISDSVRVLVNYTILADVPNSEKQFKVKLNNMDEVLYKRPVELTAETNDSLGSDPAEIGKMWISDDFLNVDFGFYGGGKVHLINLAHVADANNPEPIKFEFRHNARNDLRQHYLNGLATFNLSNFKRTGQDSVMFEVKTYTFDNATKTFTGVYRY